MTDLARIRSDRVALALLVLAAVVRGLFLVEVVRDGLDLRPRVNVDAYLSWARRVASGDILMRERYDYSGTHEDTPNAPHMNVAIAVLGAPRYDAEYGPLTYYDYPGYAYFVAPFYAVFGDGTNAVIAAQEALDLIACALVYLVALRVSDRTVARLALALVAASGPLVFYAGFLLRDSLLATLSTVLVYLAVRAETRRGWAALGLAFGTAWIFKGTYVLLLPFFAARLRRERESLVRAAAFAAGALVAVLPCAARNVALGVPPLRMTTLETASLILYNVPGSGTKGLVLQIGEAQNAAKACPELTTLGALRAAVGAHDCPFGALRQSLARAANVAIVDDPWDNVRYSWLAPRLLSLSVAPVRWKLLVPFAALGLILGLRDPRMWAPVAGPIAGAFAIAFVGVCLTRYRLSAEPVAAIFAAHALVWLVREARAKRSRSLYAVFACLALSVLLTDPEPSPRDERVSAYIRGFFPHSRLAH
jgi:hypothetical protein